MIFLKKYLLLVTFFLFISFPHQPQAYESMIRHGYFSCVPCHNSTQGGGDLNDYGKVIVADLSLYQALWSNDSVDDPSHAELKNPLWFNKLSTSVQGRLAHIRRKVTGTKRTFPMQLDLLNTFSISEKSHITSSFAKAPKPLPGRENKKDYYFRKFLYVYKLTERFYIELGKSTSPLGLQVIDHTSSIRSLNNRSVTDVSNVLAVTSYTKNNRHSFYLMNKENKKIENLTGYAVAFKEEFYFKKINNLLGFDILLENKNLNDRKLFGIYSKYFFKDFSFLGEINTSTELNKGSHVRKKASFMKFSYFPKDFWEFYITKEASLFKKRFEIKTEKNTLGTLLNITKNSTMLLEVKNQNKVKTYIFQLFINFW